MTRRTAPVLLFLLALVWFGTLGLRPLYKADESRYAEIPREMVASGDWITPRLNGFKYFEKPPLQYWATAAFFEVLGEQDWVARLWTAATGFAGLFLVFLSARKLFGPAAAFPAALVLAGSPLYVLLGQVNTLDMGLTFFLSAAVFGLALGHVLIFWTACALAVLSKGLIGIVLPFATVILYILIRRDWGLIRRMRPLSGIALFLAITAPWFIAVSLANEEFAHFFFIQEHFERFTTRLHGRYQPAWYFLPVLAVGLAPWLVPFFSSFKGFLKRGAAGEFDPRLLIGLWALVVFAFFSASSSKLPSYILPLFPALALLIGASLSAAAPRLILAAQAALTILAGIAAALLAPRFAAAYPDYLPWVVAACVWAIACGIAALVLARRQNAALLALALAGIGCTQLALVGHRTLAPAFSAESLVVAAGPVPADARVYAVDAYDHSIPWYLRRTVTMVAYKDELDKAIEWERSKFIPDVRTFGEEWKKQANAYAIVAVRDFDRLRSELPMELLARDPRYVLVRKP